MSKSAAVVLAAFFVISAFGYIVLQSNSEDSDDAESKNFQCDDGEYISLELQNNGNEDCSDGSDEDIIDHSKHAHAAPVLEAILVEVEGEQFVTGNVIHDHPMEVRINWVLVSAEGTLSGNNLATDMNGAWTFDIDVENRTQNIYITFRAHNLPEDTWSDNLTITIEADSTEVNNTVGDDGVSENQTGNNTENNTSNNDTNDGDGNYTNNTTFLPPGMHNFTILQSINGEEVNRSVLVHVPSFSDEASSHPLVFGLHGNGGQPSQFVGGWLDDLVEEFGVIAIYPEGVERSWNLGKEASQANEFEFFDEVFSLLSTYSNLDSSQRYGVGISNGAGMLHTLGSYNNSFNGIVPIVTSLTTENQPSEGGSYPAVLQILGEDDGLVPIDGGVGVAGHEFLSANQSLSTWASHNNCTQTPEQNVLNDASYHSLYRNCIEGKTVQGYIVNSAGHSIPPDWNGGLKNLVWDFISLTMGGEEIVVGCMDESASNYDPMANQDSPEMCNYDQEESYDATDLAQFWMDFFQCQTGGDRPAVDDLTTSNVELHQCEVSITLNETHLIITTNGLPNHDFETTLACSQAGDCATAQSYTWSIPRSPVNDTIGGHDSTNCPEANGDKECAPDRGAVAVAINGVPIYGPEDGPGGDAVASHHGVFNEDRQPIELGICHGHAAQGGTYHYHADANCMHWHPEEGESIENDYDDSTIQAVAQNTNDGNHSKVIGVAFDGYPIYGFWGYDEQMNVVEMKSSYQLKAGETGYNGIDSYEYVEGLGHLDACNGHFGPTPDFPQGIYHYHTTMQNGNGEMGFPYFLICYHGEADMSSEAGEGQGGGDGNCDGHGETWGPGIGPPPPGCEGGAGTQSSISQISTELVFDPTVLIILLLCVATGALVRKTRNHP